MAYRRGGGGREEEGPDKGKPPGCIPDHSHCALPIDKLGGVRRCPRFVRIDAALGGQKYGVCPPSAASVRTNRGRRLTPRSSSVVGVCSNCFP